MTIDQKYEARLSALRLWANDVAARGYLAPSENDLAAIAIAKGVDAPGVDVDLVQAWQGAIRTLLKQVAFNIADPHRQLGSEYDRPEGAAAVRASAPPEVTAPGPVRAQPLEYVVEEVDVEVTEQSVPAAQAPAPPTLAERCEELLKNWRRAAVDEGRPFANQIKDRNLRAVANSKRDLEAVQAQLPGFAQDYAQEIVNLLAAVAPPAEMSHSGAPPLPDAAPHPLSAQPSMVPPAVSTGTASVHSEAPAKASTSAMAQQAQPSVAAAATASAPGQAASGVLEVSMFAAYDFMSAETTPGEIKLTRTQDGSRRYAWDPNSDPGDFKIYRIISGDGMVPYNPDQADVIAISTDAAALDPRAFRTAVRHVQVWCNSGRDQTDALNSQPVLHAMLDVVGEVPVVDIREDSGRIIGQWTALPGTEKVQIFRIPAAVAAFAGSDPAYRILAGGTNLGGFVDAEAERGVSYIYKVYTEAAVHNVNRLSAPAVVHMNVSSVLLPVDDLAATVKADDDNETVLVDLNWSIPPGGRVDIYRTATRPAAGIELKAIEEATLEQGGLRPEFRLAHPIEPLDGTASMLNVPWPVEWTRTYFTPVTVLEGRAHVGASTVSTRPTRIRNAKVVERVDSQILTFEWPDGADAVMVYSGAPGQGAEAALTGQPQEISHSGYNQRGGLYFSTLLPAVGCDLHLVPVSYEAGSRVSGTVTTINYPWLLRVSYNVAQRKNRFTGKITGLTVAVQSRMPNAQLPGFVLVYHPERLPLTAADGLHLNMMRDMDGAAPAARVFQPENRAPSDPADVWKTDQPTWDAEVRPGTGYVRLFPAVALEGLKMMAVLDPGVNELSLLSRGNSAWGLLGGR
ncbi:hypothetical protein [Arthrobacter psychrochitiniphilus]|uniref:Uncharacterized protein n=1 Tax=Arthrobacter psychrochitiniphilus TaxID=291045 RepID=A0A2V3DRU0_9MICC|nr:hypothetical protein [Arthrobacter psychrochitiniphilus]NYG19151.1 hypothetical protein [Arthrobacter psychrochitiniphilus]PXA65895.1 hypothetical protein CVS29_07710 [Arthrobacter psychrochitiniphilus]